MLAWLPVLALLVVTPESLFNLGMGYADLTGSILLGTGAVALGLWFERGDDGYVAAATVLLAAAANTKDEDLVGVCAVLVIALIALLIRRRPGRLPTFIAALAVIAAFVVPWRIWVSAHHLSDSVEPPLPHALSPVYIFDRLHDLNISAAAMVSNGISGFPWLAPVFLATCIICLVTGTALRTACFYLGAFFAIVIALLWLYTTTQQSLGFLIPTSMDRTVSVFMVLSGFAGAHLVAMLAGAPTRASPR
jgi:4-amino-4-deoxy-L-arabinose transferase-like glycosyltransferase